jgi:hypothetical protein
MRFPFLSRGACKPPRIRHVNSYTIYYDTPTCDVLNQLKTFDLVILEPHFYEKEQIVEIQAAGTQTIGYLSVMQSPRWNNERFNRLIPSDFLLLGGKKKYFPEWDSYLTDIRQTHYQNLLLAEVEEQIAKKHFQGILLDTVGDLDDQIPDPLLQAALCQAYAGWLQRLSSAYPQLTLIQNRGFICLDIALPYLHGLLWEDWQGVWKRNNWMKIQVERIRRMQKEGLFVFSVSSDTDPSHRVEAEKLRFVHTVKTKGYHYI